MSKDLFQKLSTNNPDLEAYRAFEKEIENNSDRGIVLICSSILDAQLEKLLKSFLISNKKIDKDLFSSTQALGNSSAKINMSYYLGLITETEKNNLNSIRKIRNIFAHQVNQLSFNDNRIIGLCNNLTIPKNSYLPTEITLLKKDSSSLPKVELNPIKKDTKTKNKFIYTFQYLNTLLIFKTNIHPKKTLEEEKKVYTIIEQFDITNRKINEYIKKIEQKEREIKELKKEQKIKDYDSFNKYEEYKKLLSINKYIHTILKNSEID